MIVSEVLLTFYDRLAPQHVKAGLGLSSLASRPTMAPDYDARIIGATPAAG